AGVYNNDVNNAITGSSELLSRNFLYGSHPEIHTISGLNPGTDYVFSLYSTGCEAPGGRINAFIGAMGEEAVLIDQDEFDNNNGIRIDYRYTADASGTLIITSSSMDLASSIHVVAISNREAAPVVGAPSITLQPSGT